MAQILSENELRAGRWADQMPEFDGVTLFRTSDNHFYLETASSTALASIDRLNQWCLTLVGQNITYSQILEIIQKLLDQHVQIQSIVTLDTQPVALQFHLSKESDVKFDQHWWIQWLEFAERLSVDIGLQESLLPSVRCRLACFDMDSTLIQAEVIDELAVEAGVAEKVSAITEQAMRGEIDFQESFQRRLGMLKGLPESAVQAVLTRIQFMDGAQELFAFLNKQGIRTAILSGGFDVFAQHLQQILSIDEVHANQLEFQDKVLTGAVIEPVVDAKKKQLVLESLAKKHRVPLSQTLAVGDGANDLMMLGAAGVGIAFRAKPKVQQSARVCIRFGNLSVVPYFLGLSPK